MIRLICKLRKHRFGPKQTYTKHAEFGTLVVWARSCLCADYGEVTYTTLNEAPEYRAPEASARWLH